MLLSRFVRHVSAAAVVTSLVVPAGAALACPVTGGRDAAFEPDTSEVDELLEAAREADRTAVREERIARAARVEAKRHRETAADLRESARTFPDADGSVLRAKAVVEDKLALVEDARAATAAKRAKAQRQKAAELRLSAKRLLGTDGFGIDGLGIDGRRI